MVDIRPNLNNSSIKSSSILHNYTMPTLLNQDDTSTTSSIKFNQLKGSIPSHNLKSTIVSCSNTPYVFLYGGFDENDALDGNVYLLNIETMEWEIDRKNGVEGLYREGHSAVYVNNGNVLIFGGLPFDDEVFDNNQHNHNSNSTSFNKDSLMMIYNVFDKKWIGPPPFALNNAPKSRSRHACCLSEDNSKLFISGGIVKTNPVSDLYCYDLTTGSWYGPFSFVPRFDHTIVYNNDRIYSFGGLDKDMNHVKTISYFSFKDNSIAEISISNLITNNLNYLHYDLFVLHYKKEQGLVLFVNLPTWNSNSGVDIMSMNLKTFEVEVLYSQLDLQNFINDDTNGVINLMDKNTIKYTWNCAFISDDGVLFVLGNRKRQFSQLFGNVITNNGSIESESDRFIIDQEPSEEDDELMDSSSKLSNIIRIDLKGVAKRNPTHSLSQDLETLFNSKFETDFEIITLKDEESKFKFDNSELNHETKSIKVHKSVLIARWPHFKRMIFSGMNEERESKVMIPETYSKTEALIYYLYTGKLRIQDHQFKISDLSGLLVIANLYQLQDFKYLLLSELYPQFDKFQRNFNNNKDNDITELLQLWKDLTLSNESLFNTKVLNLIKSKWNQIIKSKTFLNLDKVDIIKLCQDTNDLLVSPLIPESQMCIRQGFNLQNNSQPNSGTSSNPETQFTQSSTISELKSPSRNSLASLDLTNNPDTPIRNTNSPFLIDSPANPSTT
ncbi:uncharacterized protein KGF55_001177 [Candida pseudojiufengensis]|uniref:uncharacterized protein n=1 Tax=Candida pseudojiufengensis TaxID=497109 RepID=UPI0022242A48|nr:uncharacterized protein KGF55_001177 [Candida pseudojiufengensis]KAI5965814.1 hypothetical protein KGF55_001177 [Candida pseudojiufengensis]